MKSNAVLKAVSAGRPRQVRLLLDSGSSVNCTDDCGQTPLIRAVFIEQDKNREKILKTLLKKGALVSKADIVERNALSWACVYGRHDCVAMLLEYADVDLGLNQTDVNGQTPLFHAVTSGSAATVKLMVQALMKYGMSVDLPDYSGDSPLMQAIKLGHDVCASILVQYGKAKVGLGMKYPEDFATAEKWAIQSLRDRERVSNNRKSKFPPIITVTTKNQCNFPECRTIRARVKTPLYCGSEGDSSDEDSDIMSVASSFEDVLINGTMHAMIQRPPFGIPTSVLAVSPPSSTVVNTSSDDEVDFVSMPVIEDKKSGYKTLNEIYELKQAQMAMSYRPTAIPPPPLPTPHPTSVSLLTEASNLSIKSLKKGKKVGDKSNLTKLCSTMKRQGTNSSLKEDKPPRPSFSESEKFVSDRNMDEISSPGHGRHWPAFPTLTDKKTSLIRAPFVSQEKKNYSNI